jgi:hypothetical protein
MFEMIHDIVFHGKGGFDWYTVYNMPIWLRKFTYNKLIRYYKEKNESESSKASTVNTGKNASKTTRNINLTAPPSDIKPGQRL